MSVKDMFNEDVETSIRDSVNKQMDVLSARLKHLSSGRFKFSDEQKSECRELRVAVDNYHMYILHSDGRGMAFVAERFNDVDFVGHKSQVVALSDARMLLAGKIVQHLPMRSRGGALEFLTNLYGKNTVKIAGKKLKGAALRV